jgi:two-component system, cell cycle response regulator DivK
MNRRLVGTLNKILDGWIILVVDDTPDNLTVVKTALQFQGALVYTAASGEDGLEMLKTLRPTVILMDIRMPKMNGWEMLKVLRETLGMKCIPVIAITAYAMDSDREAILAAGFDGYISKPFDLFTISGEIERTVTQAVNKQSKSEDLSTQ